MIWIIDFQVFLRVYFFLTLRPPWRTLAPPKGGAPHSLKTTVLEGAALNPILVADAYNVPVPTQETAEESEDQINLILTEIMKGYKTHNEI